MSSDIDRDRMVQDPIQNRGREHPVPKHLPPGAETLITGQNHGPLLVAAGDELEKQIGPGPVSQSQQ